MSILSIFPLMRSAVTGAAGLVTTGVSASAAAGQSFFAELHNGVKSSPSGDEGSSKAGAQKAADAEAARKTAELNRQLQEFQRALSQRLANAGVDLRTPVQLKSDGGGNVIVDEPHPQRATIEQLFAGDKDLRSAFQYLAAACTADQAIRDPEGRNGFGDFRMTIDGAGGGISFK